MQYLQYLYENNESNNEEDKEYYCLVCTESYSTMKPDEEIGAM